MSFPIVMPEVVQQLLLVIFLLIVFTLINTIKASILFEIKFILHLFAKYIHSYIQFILTYNPLKLYNYYITIAFQI